MHWRTSAENLLILYFIFHFERIYGLQLLELKVPSLADPREDLTLDCRFDMGDDELNSVKWYKDDNEFFRYTPRSQPHVRSFPVAGIHLAGGVDGGDCNLKRCAVQLTQLTTAHSGGSYRCEVSSEGPTFHVAFDAANLTVAAIGRHDPVVEGVNAAYSTGEMVFGNCTSAPADPAPHLTWSINGRPAPALALGPPRTSRADAMNLVTRTQLLRFYAQPHHFSQPGAVMELRCEAVTPGVPAPPRSTTVTAALRDPQRNTLSNEKLAWPGNTGTTMKLNFGILSITIVLQTRSIYF